MATAANAISKAMGSGFGGSDSRALLASNRQSTEAARWLNHQAAWILDTFTVITSSPATTFMDGNVQVAQVFFDDITPDTNNSDIDINAFRTAARQQMADEDERASAHMMAGYTSTTCGEY